MSTESRERKAGAVYSLRLAEGQGLHSALKTLLEQELEEAREDMETAADNITIWRAQGRAEEVRRLFVAITPRPAA